MRLWGGRFSEENDPRVADFTRSIEVDRELAVDDLIGSVAHVRGLGRAGLLDAGRGDRRSSPGSRSCAAEVEAGTLAWDPALEDVHLNLEAALADRIGPRRRQAPHRPVAQRPGRDGPPPLAAPDGRRARCRAIVALERAFVGLAERDGDAVLPGSTHIQPAQPVLLAHHLLAYVEMLERDRGRLADLRRRANVSPLGAGALAGAGYLLDRAAHGAGSSGSTASPPTRSTPCQRPRLRGRVPGGGRARDGPPQPVRRGDHLVVEPAVRVRPRRRRVLDRLVDDAEQEEPRSRRARPRPRRPRHRCADRASSSPLKGLPLAYQRDLQEDKVPLFETRGDPRRVARDHGRAARHAHGRPASGCAPRPRRASRPRPRWPTRSSGAASRSGSRTTSSGRSSPRPRRPASASMRCRTG